MSAAAGSSGRLAFATAEFVRGDDEDMAPLLAAAADLGVEATEVAWDDAGVDWTTFDLVVLRSTWDYVGRYDEFVGWLERVDAVSALLNPLSVVRWSTDKTYLRDLAAAGVPIVPTAFADASTDIDALTLDADHHVVKPTISAGSKDTARHSTHDAARAHAAELVAAGRTAMVQPYIDTVDERGETSCLFFDGVLSHAFTKGPILAADEAPTTDRWAPEVIAPRVPSPAELSTARAALAAIPEPTLYARIDLVTLDDGTAAVLELELVEPSFFLWTDPLAAARFALACANRL